jgi:hypothetical protein
LQIGPQDLLYYLGDVLSLPGVYAAFPSRSATTEEEIAVEECGARGKRLPVEVENFRRKSYPA